MTAEQLARAKEIEALLGRLEYTRHRWQKDGGMLIADLCCYFGTVIDQQPIPSAVTAFREACLQNCSDQIEALTQEMGRL